jgi:arginase
MKIQAFEVAYDSGRFQDRMGLGPPALLKAGLVSRLRFLGHEVSVNRIRIADEFPAEIKTTFAVANAVSDRVAIARKQGSVCVVVSGNCDAAVGTVAGLDSIKTGVIWFDAHGEFHTPETTISGFLDGMGLAILTGHCWRRMAEAVPGFRRLSAKNVLLAGARDVDPEEQQLLDASGVQQIPAAQIHERGARALMAPALTAMSRHVEQLYVHFDLDVLDPTVARWNRWTPSQGLILDQVEEALNVLAGGPPIVGVGFASHEPEIDPDRSYEAARRLIDCALGVAGA